MRNSRLMETLKQQIGARALVLIPFFLLAQGVSGCTKDGGAATDERKPSATEAQMPSVLATIGDERVTMDDVRGRVGDELEQLDAQYARAKSKIVESALQAILRERILGAEAKKKGKTVDELVALEAGGSLEPSEIDIATWYKENPDKVAGRPMDQIRTQVADLLRQRKRTDAEKKLEQRLDQERKVAIQFQPYRLVFNNDGAPSLGKQGAPVTVTEFSDFQCPFCKQFAPNMRQLEKQFGNNVYIVYRQYPIPSLHPFAIKAAEASLCANEQGKFWELHDIMFADQQKLSVSDLKETARRSGMDGKKFDSCLDTGRYTERVQNDMKEGSKAGVTGTPAVFVNGVEVPGGAVPFQTVADAVQKELAKSKSGT